MSRFQKLVRFLSIEYQMDEVAVADVCLDLFKRGVFNWRAL